MGVTMDEELTTVEIIVIVLSSLVFGVGMLSVAIYLV